MASVLQTKRLVWSIVLLLGTLAAASSYVSGGRYLATVAAVEQTMAVQSEIDATLSLLKDAETGHRGYLLTGDDAFLEPFQTAVAGIPTHLGALALATSNEPAQR